LKPGEYGQRSTAKSAAYLERAERAIPGVSQTFSKNPNQFVRGVSPAFIERGRDGRVWDVDGNEFIDFPMSLLPVVLGHNDADVTAAVQAQISEGTIFSLPHPLEIEVSEMLIEEIPCAEMVRFGKSGTDSTTAAIRVARGFTRRDRVAICGYHGWADWYIGTTTRNLGVPVAVSALSHTFDYNNLESLKALFDQHPGEFAAVIMEPTGVVAPDDGFLEGVAELAHDNGALLIFDEVITGFRINLGGAQTHFGVTPDLAAFGKGMANGYPISAVVGRADVMDVFDEVFYSGTFAGETVSLAATKATINKMRREPVIDRLWATGTRLQDGYNAIAAEVGLAMNTACIGLPPHTVAPFSDDAGEDSLALRSLLQQELARRGVLYLVGFNICYAHSDEDVDITLKALRESMQVVADAKNNNRIEEALAGPAAEAVFRKA
jgi:glutamate-1-semialdehyde aminotransferase